MKADYKSFYWLVALILLTRGADAVTTYIGSPDLQYELNPVVGVFHQGWLGLFLVTASLTAGLLYLAYLHYVHPLDYGSVPTAYSQSPTQFAAFAAFGNGGKITNFLYRLPNLKLLARWTGFVGGYTLLFYGFFVVANNLVLIYPSFLTEPWINAGLASTTVDGIFITTSVFLLTVHFFKTQYRNVQNISYYSNQNIAAN